MEIWKPIPNYENYEVSSLGRVRSLNYNNQTDKVRILKLAIRKDGYTQIMLNKEGKCKMYSVHRLVAEAFIPNPNNLPCVNHIDENKQNNDVSNLEWCSYGYNINYGSRNERASKAHCKPVICLELKRIFNSATEASEYLRCHPSGVSKAISKGHKRKGYTFNYITTIEL